MIISYILFIFLVEVGSVYEVQEYIGVSTILIISTIFTCSIYIVTKTKEHLNLKENKEKSRENIENKLLKLRDEGIFDSDEIELKVCQYKKYVKSEGTKNKFKKNSEFLLSLKKLNILTEEEYNNKLNLLNELYEESQKL